MEDLRKTYESLKAKAGASLLDAETLKREHAERERAEVEASAPQPVTATEEEPKEKDVKVDVETLTIGDVKIKDLIIAATNAIIKDNEELLFTNGEIDVTVQDILEYAELTIDDIINEFPEEFYSYGVTTDAGGEETLLHAIVYAALQEFGTRGWDVTAYNKTGDKESLEEINNDLAEVSNLYRELGMGILGEVDEEEMKTLLDMTRKTLIASEFVESPVTFSFEEDGSEDEYEDDEEDEYEYEDDEEDADERPEDHEITWEDLKSTIESIFGKTGLFKCKEDHEEDK